MKLKNVWQLDSQSHLIQQDLFLHSDQIVDFDDGGDELDCHD